MSATDPRVAGSIHPGGISFHATTPTGPTRRKGQPMSRTAPSTEDPLALAFAPLHKLGMGLGVGTAAALAVFVLTAVPLLRNEAPQLDIGLLGAYFSGYEVSWRGAFIGAAWAGFSGFVLGWFFAFSRNALLAIRLVVWRARADYMATRDFMDHI
ncbi:MAG: hypothetical protein AB7P61_13665 [Gemmatimonadales bacterium]